MSADRTTELILYLCRRCDTERYWGRTKLFKLLFFCDFWMYREASRPITGLKYWRFDQGPVPKDVYVLLERLEKVGDLVEVDRTVDDFMEKRPIALRKPDLDLFSGSEMAVIDRVIAQFGSMTAREISDASHGHPGWIYTPPGEEIPLVLGLESIRKPSDEEMAELERRRTA